MLNYHCINTGFQDWKKNISTEDYVDANKIFNKNNMNNMFDYLEYDNNCDVIPMAEAIN